MTAIAPPPHHISPSRKAIADKFAILSKSVAASPTKRGTEQLRQSTSPFKRPLLNTSRGNRREEDDFKEHASHSKSSNLLVRQPESAADESISFSLSRGPNMSSTDLDLMGSVEDSFLAEARKLGDETFDRKLMDRSPQRGIQKQLAVRSSNAGSLGIGRPSTKEVADSTISLGHRSFSTTSDTSNLFEETGEQSLLYASALLDRAMPGGKSSDKVKMLEALAEYRGEASARSRPQSIIVGGSSSSSFGSAKEVTRATPLRASVTEGVRTATDRSKRVSFSRSANIAPANKNSAARTTTSQGIPATPATPRRIDSSSAEIAEGTPRSLPGMTTTPRSRPPLNASAARMRRLSGLPQLVTGDGSMGPPQAIRAKVTLVGSASASSSSTTSGSRFKERPRSMIGRPSLSTSSLAARPPSDGGQFHPPSLPTPSSSSLSPKKVLPHPSEALTGQLARRPSITSTTRPIQTNTIARAGTTTGDATPLLQSTSHRPPRPFLLGAGTNHGPSPSSTTTTTNRPSHLSASSSSSVAPGARPTPCSPRKSHIPTLSNTTGNSNSTRGSSSSSSGGIIGGSSHFSNSSSSSSGGGGGGGSGGRRMVKSPSSTSSLASTSAAHQRREFVGTSSADVVIAAAAAAAFAASSGVSLPQDEEAKRSLSRPIRPRPMSMMARPRSSVSVSVDPAGFSTSAMARRTSFGYRKADE